MKRPASNRRAVLGTVGGLLAGTAGCLERFQVGVQRSTPDPLSFTIRTTPADEDGMAIRIARHLSENLQAVGVDTAIEPQTEHQLFRSVCLDHEFDIFVARVPGFDAPDQLRSLLHSRFAEELGWQNPFGMTSPRLDELLELQARQRGDPRRETIAKIQREIVRRQPFSVVAYPRHDTVVSTPLAERLNLVDFRTLEPLLAAPRPDPPIDTLRVGTFTTYVTENRNPLSVAARDRNEIFDLVYDPLVRTTPDGTVPWLATDWSIEDSELRIEIRENLDWHDGRSLTADDVAFTYRFLADTSLGSATSPIPAPRFRARSSLVDDTLVLDDRTLVVSLERSNPTTRRRLLSVPVLPEHVWSDRTSVLQDSLTEALVSENPEVIGSGPVRFLEAEVGDRVVFERNEDHFVERVDSEPRPTPFDGLLPFDRLQIESKPSPVAAVEQVGAGDLDAIMSPLEPDVVAETDDIDDVRLLTDETPEFYLVGYNVRTHPLGNHRFRRAVSRLIDRSWLVESALSGRGIPSDSPLARSTYVPGDLLWSGESEVGSFPGQDGTLDPRAARELFRTAGFRFDDEDRLVTGGSE